MAVEDLDPELTQSAVRTEDARVARWRIAVTAGPAAGAAITAAAGLVRVGSAADNDLVIRDAQVSRHHLELAIAPTGVIVRDLDSKNGTYYAGSLIEKVDLPISGGAVELGDSALAISPAPEVDALTPSTASRCCRLVGASAAMRLLYAQIERVATRASTVLVHGETGSGKELVAEAIHELSPRKAGPFVVLDCGAVAPSLVESELFGHMRGAFTGAVADHRGAFARADGGTLFLDEIGELDLDLQPKLLRVLETGTFRPLGSEKQLSCDVRVVAASHRDLGEMVAAGRFRADLYYRLAVVQLAVPPLRSRPGDVRLLAAHFLGEMGAAPLDAESMARLEAHAWPGNVRQLRNVLENAVALAGNGTPVVRTPDLTSPAAMETPSSLLAMPYKLAKNQMVDRFTRDYVEALVARHGGNVSAAARAAGIDRNWLVALAKRHGLRIRD